MKKQVLTAKEVEHARPDPNKRIEIPVGDNLYLIVQISGAKSWALRYRWHGKTRKLTLGSYPEMKLAHARASAEAARADLDKDIDPAAAKAEEQQLEEPDSVEQVAEEWLKRHVRVNVDWPEAERILKNNIVKPWKHKLITDIGRADVLRIIDTVRDRGAAVQANRTLAVARAWFNWCVARGILPVSPAAGIQPPTTETSRDRVLTPEELVDVWMAAESIRYPIGTYLKFLTLVAQRKGEVAAMKWAHVDMDRALWTLTAEATKAGRVHDVPLSDAALEILRSLPRFTKGDYIWTTTSGEKAINGFSKAKSRLDQQILKQRTERGIEKNITDWTLHDLRRTAATHMAEAGVPPHVLAAILNHTPGSTQGVTSIYNRFRYSEERRAALKAWSEHVLKLTEEKPAATAASA
jgi:integrase